MIRRILFALPFLLGAFAANAQDENAAANLQGTWKLVSFYMVDEETKEQKFHYGQSPKGYMVLLSNGRMMNVITGEDRKKPETDEDRAAAFKSLIAYSGTYRIEGGAFITKVDVAWNEAWVGTDQKRDFKIEGDKLTITSMAQPAVNFDNRMMHGELVWERVK